MRMQSLPKWYCDMFNNASMTPTSGLLLISSASNSNSENYSFLSEMAKRGAEEKYLT